MEFSDRISSYPGRYLMTDENGNTSYVILERADEPTRVGTPLNAETFNGMQSEIYGATAAKNHSHEGVYTYGARRSYNSGAQSASTKTLTISSNKEKFYIVYILGYNYAGTTVCIDWQMLSTGKAITYCILNPNGAVPEYGRLHVSETSDKKIVFSLESQYDAHCVWHVCGYM